MGYPQHWLLAFGGHQGHVEEMWANGIRLCLYGEFGPVFMDEEQYLTDTAVPALTAWFTSVGAKIYSGARITWIKFNEIDADGLYADASTTHERLALNIAGGGGSSPLHPLQVAAVLSWRTNDAERGLASRGRIYQPRPCITVDVNGDIASGDRASLASAAALLLNSLDVSVGTPPAPVLRPSIVSRGKKSGSTWGEGANHQIDSVVVDSALDIQRRRANRQSREQSTAAVVYT